MSNGFGAALAEFMDQFQLTQQEVADRTGVAQPVIGRILKSAQPELPTISKIAAGLDADIQVTANGDITIDPIKIPTDIKVEAFSACGVDPRKVFVHMYDELNHRWVMEATLIFRKGEREPYSVTFERKDGAPGYYSNFWLMRWAKYFALGVLQQH